MKSSVVKPSDFDCAKITITEPRKRKDKSGKEKTSAFIQYDKKPLWLETPWCRTPFGVSSYTAGGSDSASWSVGLSRTEGGLDDNELCNQFFDELLNLQNYMVTFGVENSEMIFGEKKIKEVVEALTGKFVKQDKDNKYPPRISPAHLPPGFAAL